MEDLKRDMAFIREIDKMKAILRQTKLIEEDRFENDAEHSWHIAVMAMMLGKYMNNKPNTDKVVRMLLIHDLIEIYAGDTFCYDELGNQSKRERELEAADEIFGMPREEVGFEFRSLWDEFEEMKTPEAICAAAIDRLQPMLNNYYGGGGSWVRHSISRQQVLKRIEPLKKASDKLYSFILGIIDDAVQKGFIEEETYES